MARDTTRLPFTRELKRLGFTRDGTEKDPLFYVKVVDSRRVEVQLWRDGLFRVSHMLNGRGTTPPTAFDSVDSMKVAIEHELSRTDHKPRV